MSEINFLPASYRRQQLNRRWRVRQGVAMVLAVACLFGWWSVQQQATARAEQQHQSLVIAADAANDQQAAIVRLRTEHDVLRHQVEMRRELEMPVRHSVILATLSDLLPPEVGLTKLKLVTQRPEPMRRDVYESLRDRPDALKQREEALREKAKPDQMLVEFEAFAPDDLAVASVVDQLSGSALFTDVKMHFSRQSEHRGWIGRRFRISASVALDRRYDAVRTALLEQGGSYGSR